jgi:hypothetical protein
MDDTRKDAGSVSYSKKNGAVTPSWTCVYKSTPAHLLAEIPIESYQEKEESNVFKVESPNYHSNAIIVNSVNVSEGITNVFMKSDYSQCDAASLSWLLPSFSHQLNSTRHR